MTVLPTSLAGPSQRYWRLVPEGFSCMLQPMVHSTMTAGTQASWPCATWSSVLQGVGLSKQIIDEADRARVSWRSAHPLTSTPRMPLMSPAGSCMAKIQRK